MQILRRESPNGEKTMNGLVIVLIAIVVLGAGYLLYGRWLASKWGLDPKAKTPAYTHEDGQDYVPSSKLTVFAHQFSSIAGAGPVTGPILASVFGWVPVLLWLLIGGLFFGAVQDFGALYASVKNEGKSMGMIIEKYIGRTGRKLFMLFCWLFTLLVMAAFTDMVAGTFVGKGVEGMTKATGYANSAAASISMLFIVVAIIFGLIQKKVGKMKEWVRAVVAIALLVVMFIIGMKLPMYATKSTWIYIVMAYLFLASVMPMWLLMEPRDYMTTFMLLGMIIGAVVGVIAEHPTMKLNAFSGFNVDGSYLFPTLFVTIACGAVSGFHSLVSSGTSSKTRGTARSHCTGCCWCGCRKRNKAGGYSVFHFLYGCCRIFRKIRYSGTGCYRIYDDVCICTGTDLSRFCCTDRTYVVSGAVLRGYY